MPELPEVETVRRTLAPAVGLRVDAVRASKLPLRQGKPVALAALRRAASGSRIEAVRRWGKYLLIDFAESGQVLLVHLGMTGRLRLVARDEPAVAHTHMVLSLHGRPGAPAELRFSDPRRFGFVALAVRGREREHPALADLGPDPLLESIGGDYLREQARGSKRSLKSFLLDQSVMAGIGNIYASEALWLAGLRPSAQARRLTAPRADALARAVAEVLDHALTHGGTTLRDFVAADGASGEYSHYLRVYGREGEACLRGCGGVIRRAVHQGRSSFYCPRCQFA